MAADLLVSVPQRKSFGRFSGRVRPDICGFLDPGDFHRLVAPTTCSVLLVLTTCLVTRFGRTTGGVVTRFGRIWGEMVTRFGRGKLTRITQACGNKRFTAF